MTSMTPNRPPGGGGKPRGPRGFGPTDGPILGKPGGIKGGPRPVKTSTPPAPPSGGGGKPRGRRREEQEG